MKALVSPRALLVGFELCKLGAKWAAGCSRGIPARWSKDGAKLLPQASPAAICSLFIWGSWEWLCSPGVPLDWEGVGSSATEWPESHLPLPLNRPLICPDCKFQILSRTEAPSASTSSAPESNTPKQKLLLLPYNPLQNTPKEPELEQDTGTIYSLSPWIRGVVLGAAC